MLTGQLMGSLLCFPLLCLQNYIAFRFCFGRSTPVRINGDDIVFRSSPKRVEAWREFCSRVGLVLSPGKTLVDSRFWSLNSTFFDSKPVSGPRLVPVIRSTSLWNRLECVVGVPSALQRFLRGFSGRFRDQLGGWYLRSHSPEIRASGRALRDLELRRPLVSREMLVAGGYWQRELWYLSCVPASLRRELPPPPLSIEWSAPKGWCLVEPVTRRGFKRARSDPSFWEELTESAWGPVPESRPDAVQTWWLDAKTTGLEGFFRSFRGRRHRTSCPRFGPTCALRPCWSERGWCGFLPIPGKFGGVPGGFRSSRAGVAALREGERDFMSLLMESRRARVWVRKESGPVRTRPMRFQLSSE